MGTSFSLTKPNNLLDLFGLSGLFLKLNQHGLRFLCKVEKFIHHVDFLKYTDIYMELITDTNLLSLQYFLSGIT